MCIYFIVVCIIIIAVDCGDPDAPDDNGSVNVTSTTLDSTAIYSCNEGYIINGTKTVICQANETWSDTAPVCKRKWNVL